MPTLKDALYLSGDLFLPKSVRTTLEHYHVGNDKSLVYVTNWSFMHLLAGLIVGWILKTYYEEYDYYWTGLAVHTFWEVWQILVKNTPIWKLRGVIDIGTDTLFFVAGMGIFSRVFTGKDGKYSI
jgi:hypothetical protein